MRILTLALLLTILIWCSTTMETCNARKGKHWRQHRATTSVSLWKKKGKGHTSNHNHHGHTKSKPKTPSSPNIPLMPPPTPSPNIPPMPPLPQPPSPNIPLMPPPPPSPKVPLTPPPSSPPLMPPPSSPPLMPPPSSPPLMPPPPSPQTPLIPLPSPKTPLLPPPPSPKTPLLPPPPSPKTPLMPTPPPSPSPKAAVPAPVKPPSSNEAIYDVLEFGAKGDGTTDDTKAFQAAWAAACTVEASTVVVPLGYIFLVGPISFSGYFCQANILFQLDGTIIAPTNSGAWGKGLLQWLEFTKLRGFTIRGKGIVDGRGSVWWQNTLLDDPIDNEERLIVPLNNTLKKHLPTPINSELSQQMPSIKPTAVRFYGSFNVTVTGITIQNSPQCHLKFDNCMGVSVYEINVSSPGDSPNTDGIHLQNSQQVLIHSVNLACGDDCISIQTGCSNVYVHNVKCGPGHGISIGSLGKDNSKACVSNITVRDVVMQNTMNGVRIKTWQGGAGSVQGVLFSNIQVSEVQLPIVIDQYYCDKSKCKNQTSAVSLTGITYEKIRGTYTVKPVHFACSDSLPCIDVTLNNIELKPIQEHYHLYDPFCWQTFGELSTPTVPPIDCLELGKPTGNRILSDHDYC